MKKIEYLTYRKPTDFMKFEVGDNQLRIISTGVMGLQHSMKTANRFINLGICSDDGNCPHCAKGYEPKRVWKWIVFDYSDKQVKILDAGPMIGNQICELAANLQVDPQEFDLVVNKEGAGLKTEYLVTKASKDLEISGDQKSTFEFKKKRLVSKYLSIK